MPRCGSDIVFATIILLLCGSFAAGCTRDDPAAEKQQQTAPSVTATAAPSVAATQAGAIDDPYEDALVLLVEGDPDSGPAPLVVQFEVESLVVDEIAGGRYTWDFGDGSPKSNEANPSHTYEKPGEYTATVNVVDAAGQQGIDEVDILVEEPEDQGATP
jgi:PKD repeat protein